MQLNKAEYQLKPKDTSTQHIYVLIQYSMYVYIYMHKYVYVTLQGECHSGLLNCNNLLPPAIPESFVH